MDARTAETVTMADCAARLASCDDPVGTPLDLMFEAMHALAFEGQAHSINFDCAAVVAGRPDDATALQMIDAVAIAGPCRVFGGMTDAEHQLEDPTWRDLARLAARDVAASGRMDSSYFEGLWAYEDGTHLLVVGT